MDTSTPAIYYDASCGLCSAGRSRFGRIVERRGFTLVPLQAPGVARRLGLREGEIPEEVKVQTAAGEVLGGAEAIVHLCRHVWWAWPVYAVSRVPGGMWVLRRVYGRVARNRYRISGACGLRGEGSLVSRVSGFTELTDAGDRDGGSRGLTAAGVALAIVVTLVLGVVVAWHGWWSALPRWGWMWTIAGGVWLGCKAVAWRVAGGRVVGAGADRRTALAWFFGWPGMDARPFLERGKSPRPILRVLRRDLTEAIIKTLVGAAMIWLAVPLAARRSPLLAGWLGMIGLVLLLHFGIFHLLSIAWRARGIAAMPIMNHPLRARSLGDFWGRWNRGFRDIAYVLVFRPMFRRSNAAVAAIAAFLFSGLIHDLVITVPAGAAFGRPTIYFLLQGAGVVWEKSPAGRRLPAWLTRGLMFLVLIAPLPLLFPVAFVRRVALPFLGAIGAFATERSLTMPAISLVRLIFIGGLLHFGILIASALVPRVLDWRGELRKLRPLSRQLVWVHGAFIVLTIIGLGAIATLNAAALAAGASMLARCVCGFVAIFWGARLAIQLALFEPGELLSNRVLKLGYHGLTFVFAYLTGVFAWAAFA